MVAAGLTVAVGLTAVRPSGEALPWVPILAVWTSLYAGGFAFVPWVVAVVVAEGFRIRSVWFWLAVGGGVGAAGFLLDDVAAGTPWDGFSLAFYLAPGFVAGLVYWLVVGWSAGFRGERPRPGSD